MKTVLYDAAPVLSEGDLKVTIVNATNAIRHTLMISNVRNKRSVIRHNEITKIYLNLGFPLILT